MRERSDQGNVSHQDTKGTKNGPMTFVVSVSLVPLWRMLTQP